MWLLPVFSLLSRLAARIFYRLTVGGEPVPRTGPLLLVANHPNSLLDPMLVAAAAGRPVRLFAKAPLFDDPKLGWLMRAAGAIPVYRREDDPTLMSRNQDSLLAASRQLAAGAAVGIFPEGLSHSQPEMASLKTGAARIALGACREHGGTFPIVPIGLVPRAKEVFRSEMIVVRGPPIAWNDLASRSDEDRDAVQALTVRIDDALREVTLNLERWEDRSLIECAEAVWATVHEADPDPAKRVRRLCVATDGLRRLRNEPENDLIQRVTTHAARLARLGLTPDQLHEDARATTAVRWGIRRLYLVNLPLLASAIAGAMVFWIPREVTALTARAGSSAPDQVSTWKLILGIPVYAAWILALGTAADVAWGPVAGLGALLLTPLLGLAGLWARERWREALGDIRRFLRLRARRSLVKALRDEQHLIADALDRISLTTRNGEARPVQPPPPPPP